MGTFHGSDGPRIVFNWFEVHQVYFPISDSVSADSWLVLLLNYLVSNRTDNESILACFFIVDVVLALHDRYVWNDEGRVDLLVENAAVTYLFELSQLDISYDFRKFIDEVVAVGGDQFSCKSFLSKPDDRFRSCRAPLLLDCVLPWLVLIDKRHVLRLLNEELRVFE